MRKLTAGMALALMCIGCRGEPPDLPPVHPLPSPEQVRYQEMELAGFIHFSINTFTDREWGFGDESPALFAPSELDVAQWARVAAEFGMGELILTAKHHDGFCLWPSQTTDHDIAAAPWRGGEGDLVAEFAAAARQRGLAVGLYLSPWDRNHPGYGGPEYLEAYRAQLRELLTGYGGIAEIWVDGANGGTGYYGGANEERRIDRRTYYRWPETMAMVKDLQPSTLIFSDAGPDIRWIGNERGFAGETNWSTITTRDIVIGEADVEYLNSGDRSGEEWVVPLCDTSIRPGWFYHADQDDRVKSPQQLVDLYYRSVGRNCVLLLNIPPDRRGRFHENDIRALEETRSILDETFARDLASEAEAEVRATSWRRGHAKFAPRNVVDGVGDTYWVPEEGDSEAGLEILLPEIREFDRILLQEPIRLGQRVASFSVEAREDGEWRNVADGTTIGHKRLLRFPLVRAEAVRITIQDARATPALATVGLYRASPREPPLPPRTGPRRPGS
jgi:alpha-L-fucosidase